ncbi:MAG TPA: efflux RND transporter periplasmic adaptor subunit, partial [Candidatus Dormibacteraeota bacterium]|nr:efflux RND transporter periplasmic adaptor subunit [Candidatus Dormibacteraeota bacterium]
MRRLRSILAVAAAITIVAVGVVWLLRARTNTAGPRYVTAPAAYGSITASVDETGTVNPVDQIQVGT